MAETTKIQWCNHTFNPWRGCEHAKLPDGSDHPGCGNCYAEAMSRRNSKTLGVWGPEGTRVVAAESQWKLVEKWNREAGEACERRRVFCASLADVFEDWQRPMLRHDGCSMWCCPECYEWRDGALPDIQTVSPWCYKHTACVPLRMVNVRARLFRLIDHCQNLDFLMLTKRPENVLRMWPTASAAIMGRNVNALPRGRHGSYRSNVWLLTSVSDQKTADAMIPKLLECRFVVPVLGISAEPLLGPVDIIQTMQDENDFLDWCIVGGESGNDARPCNVEWIRSIVGQCKAAEVPVFVKQLGANCTTRLDRGESWPGHSGPSSPLQFSGDGFGNYSVIGLTDPKGGDPAEWPADLRVREQPERDRQPGDAAGVDRGCTASSSERSFIP